MYCSADANLDEYEIHEFMITVDTANIMRVEIVDAEQFHNIVVFCSCCWFPFSVPCQDCVTKILLNVELRVV